MCVLIPKKEEAKVRTSKKSITKKYKIDSQYIGIGHGLKYYVKTYGCQMNVHDSENIKAILDEMKFDETNSMEDADLIILNTCAIRENAHNKAFGMLGRIKHMKEKNPSLLAGLCGCMAQEEGVVDEIIKKHNFLDIVFGTHNIDELPSILEKSIKNKSLEVQVYSCEGNIVEDIPVKRDSKYKAWVNVMYGCDKFCTYCIVPYTRGKQRSRNPKDIIKEVLKLKKDGYKEVTLLGQNVNAYGKDLDLDYDMGDLLEDISNIQIERIRFITSHPWDFTDKMIDVISKKNNIMPYIHLPLQSGSNKILKLMGRRYTKESYLNLYQKIKHKVKNVAITTDIIVGFPGEDEKDFEATLEVVKKCKFDSAFTFIFSKREGTPAAKMKDDVSIKEKEDRLYKLNELVNRFSKDANEKYRGKIVKVLVEGISTKDENQLYGYTETMKLVNVKGSADCIGKIVDVKITNVQTWSLDGKVV